MARRWADAAGRGFVRIWRRHQRPCGARPGPGGRHRLGGGALLLAGGAAMGGRAVPPSGAAWLLLGYLAVLSAMAFTIWTLLLKYNPVAKISIYNSLTPVFGALCSAVVLGDRFFSIKNLAALALVCGGVYLVNCVPDGTGRGKTERV